MTRIRLRTDSWLRADDAARIARGHRSLWHFVEQGELAGVVPAAPGDCWRVRWYSAQGEGPIAGYAICCPTCKQVHSWTSARNCAAKGASGSCAHSGSGSCWTWSGSAELRTLTASPSLHAIDDRGDGGTADDGHGCGWHGWLTNGELRPC